MTEGKFTIAGLNAAANGVPIDKVSLHYGDPGAAGTANELPKTGDIYNRQNIQFGLAEDGEREQVEDVPVPVPPGAAVSHWALWGGGVAVQTGPFEHVETYAAAGVHVVNLGKVRVANKQIVA